MMWTRCVQLESPTSPWQLSTIDTQVGQGCSPLPSTGMTLDNTLMEKKKDAPSTYTQDQLIQQQGFFL